MPDAKTIWMFRERLTRAGAIDRLFRRFDAAVRAAGYIAMSGQLVDSTLVAAPKQRNTRDEKQAAKAGKTAHENLAGPGGEGAAERRGRPLDDPNREGPAGPGAQGAPGHCDPDLRLQGPHEYRSTVSIDPLLGRHRRQPARRVAVAPGLARPHEHPAPASGADTAYRSQQNETFLERHGFISHIHRRRLPGRPLPAHIRRGNATRSRERAPVEHVFAVQKQAMGLMIRTIGLARSPHEDRHGQPCLQHPSPRPARRSDPRLTVLPRGWSAPTS